MAPASNGRFWKTATLLLFALFQLIFSTSAGATDSPALALLRDIQRIRASQGDLTPQQVQPLLALGRLYASGQCENALDILDIALQVSRRTEGLFNPEQLEIYEPMLNCYTNLDRPDELRRAQQYIVMIGEQRFGPQDLRMLETLQEGGRRYEDVGLYYSARKLYRRAIDIVDRVGRGRLKGDIAAFADDAGAKELSLVAPLRGMARAFRMEYTYGLALPDVLDLAQEINEVSSNASFDERMGARLDRLGQRSLERAVEILSDHPEAVDAEARHRTLLELGDWYQLDGNRRLATRTYRRLWEEGQTQLLSTAEPLLTHYERGVPMRRPPANADSLKHYVIDLDYTVTRDGWARDVKILESNAPKRHDDQAIQDIKHTWFRPRFVNGEPVDTPNVHQRQSIYADR